jgi:hypothetical protein
MSETAEKHSVRRRRNRAEVEQLVAEYESSGLTRKLFCAERGLSLGTLDKYRKRQRRALGCGEGRIVPVKVLSSISATAENRTETRSALWLELSNGWRIEVGCGFDAPTLERLVAVLDKA